MKRRSKITLVVALVLLLATTAFVIGVSASDNTPSLSVTGANVSFQETVHLWYAVGHENISNPDAIKLLVWREGSISNVSECVLGSQNYTLDVVGEVNEGKVQGKTFEFAGLAASEMTENVYARAYVEEDGEIIYSPVVKYSILQYALNKTGVTGTISPNEHLRKMLKEMLEYGAAAQLYFDPDTTAPLATDDFVKITVEDATLPDGTKSGIFKVGTEVKLIASPTAENPYVLWTDENGKLLSAKENYTFTAKKNITCTATISNEPSSFGLYDHVVIVGLDGAGSWFKDINTPNMDRIFGNTEDSLQPGALTYNMRVTSPTSSAPSWLSFFHGVNPEHHGINENYVVENADNPFPTDSKFPSFLRVIGEQKQGAKLISIATWSAINIGIVENGFGIEKINSTDAGGTEAAVNYINNNNDLDVLYIHLNDPDAKGHANGYGTETYLAELESIDGQIGSIYDALVANDMIEDTLFIVTTDHGGRIETNSQGVVSGTHGGLSDEEKYVVFGAAGKTVQSGYEEIKDMEIRDCASIVLYALGYQQPDTYTSRIPTGVFEGVEASARPVYHDPDNPRDVVSKPTPSLGTEDSIENFVNNDLITYLPFDGNANEIKGNSPTSENGEVQYVEGYFGEAAKLDDGYITLNNFKPGVESFTISFWMKSPSAYSYSPVLMSKNTGDSNRGLAVWLVRDTKNAHHIKFNAAASTSGNATIDYDEVVLPENYFRGWTHVLLTVDRDNNTMSLCYDFGEVYTVAANFSGSLTLSEGILNIGQTLNGNYSVKCGLSIDELMIFDGAFTKNDIDNLNAYYGKGPKVPYTEEGDTHVPAPTPENAAGDINALIPDKNLDIFFDFDKNTVNTGTSNFVAEVHDSLLYRNGFRGNSVRLSNGFIQIPEYTFGTRDFSISFWINCSAIDSSNVPIVATQNMSKNTNAGFSFILSKEYGTLIFRLCDGSSRIQETVAIPEGFTDGWQHLTFSVDHTAKKYKLYYNFIEIMNVDLKLYSGSGLPADQIPADGADGSWLSLGQDGEGDWTLPLKANLDEFMVWDGALNADDMSKLYEYYFPKRPVTDFLDKAPDYYFNFDGEVKNLGNEDLAYTPQGTLSYVEGAVGSAADFSKGYVKLDENYKFGKGSFSIGFWINTSLKAGDPLIISNANFDSSRNDGLSIFYQGGKINFNMANGTQRIRNSWSLPDGYEGNWVYVLCVVDRENGEFKISFNYEELQTYKMAWYSSDSQTGNIADVDADGSGNLNIGQDGDGDYTFIVASFDEFMIWREALDEEDLAALQSYFNQ